MRKGFTLIELLVAISIISLMSSVVYSSATDAREKARDSARIQQVRQINNAVNLYTSQNGHAPDLQGTCNASSNGGTASCVARSTATFGSNQGKAWTKFLQDIQPFIPATQLQADPCGMSGCESSTGEETGYVYVAPSAMEEVCAGSCGYDGNFDDSYQLYAFREQDDPYGHNSFGGGGGGGGGGGFYNPYNPAPTISMSVSISQNKNYRFDLDYSTTHATACNGWASDNSSIVSVLMPSGHLNLVSGWEEVFTLQCTGPGGNTTSSITLPADPSNPNQ